MSFPVRLQPRPATWLNHFALLFMINRERPKGNSFCMGARSHGGSGSPQIFRDVGERDIRDDALPKSLIFVCSPCLPVVYSSRCDISGHARFRALDAAGLSFFASALAARLPLIGSSISFCPAAALGGFLPFAGSALRSFAMLCFRASIRSTTFSPLAAPSQQWACRCASHAIQAAAFARREPEPRVQERTAAAG